MTEIVKKINASELSPNSYFLLHSIVNSIDYKLNIDKGKEKIKLRALGYLEKDIPTKKAFELFGEVLDEDFQKQKEREEKAMLMNALRISQFFPPIYLPSGAHSRGFLGTVKDRLKAFVQIYPYDWDTIFKATESYIERYKEKGYKYMRNCPNFILNEKGESALHLECEIIQNSSQIEDSYDLL